MCGIPARGRFQRFPDQVHAYVHDMILIWELDLDLDLAFKADLLLCKDKIIGNDLIFDLDQTQGDLPHLCGDVFV